MKTIQTVMDGWGIVISLFLCVNISVTYFDKERDKVPKALQQMMALNGMLHVSDIVCCLFEGDVSKVGIVLNNVGNFIYFILIALLGMCFSYYYRCIILWAGEKRRPIFSNNTLFLGLLMIVMVCCNVFTGWFYYVSKGNVYYRGIYFQVLCGLQFTMLASITIGICSYIRTKIGRISLMHLALFPAIYIMGIIQARYFRYSIIPVSFTLVLFFCYTLHIKIQAELLKEQAEKLLMQEERLKEQQRQLTEQEQKLEETQEILANTKMRLLIAQIKPHFIYNTITMIRSLCYTDGETAAESLAKLAKFLRGSVNSINSKKSIELKEELGIVRSYVYLQKKRFGERLEYVENIETMDCWLPSMTLQIMVENAIIHGIEARGDGGKVSLHVYKKDNTTELIVSDNGVGFDTEKTIDEREHFGLATVRKRLETMCDGKLTIDSIRGEGTTVRIVIPDQM